MEEKTFQREEIVAKLQILKQLQDAVIENLQKQSEFGPTQKGFKRIGNIIQGPSVPQASETIDEQLQTIRYVMSHMPEYTTRTLELKAKFEELNHRVQRLQRIQQQ